MAAAHELLGIPMLGDASGLPAETLVLYLAYFRKTESAEWREKLARQRLEREADKRVQQPSQAQQQEQDAERVERPRGQPREQAATDDGKGGQLPVITSLPSVVHAGTVERLCAKGHSVREEVTGKTNKPFCSLCQTKISAKTAYLRCQCSILCGTCSGQRALALTHQKVSAYSPRF
jgi:hypothetical protein